MLTITAFEPCKENRELLCQISSSISPAPTFVCLLKNFQGCLSHPSANVISHFPTPCIFTRLGWEWYHKNADDYSFRTMQRKWGISMSDFQFHFASSNVCLLAQIFP